jgi:hypothetical protein
VELSYGATMLGLGRICANPPPVDEAVKLGGEGILCANGLIFLSIAATR